jgi:YbbR domain-containing protein
MTRLVGFIVRNWPLKLAAIVLATLLYAGLVLSQNTRELPVSVQIDAVNQPPNTYLLTDLGTVTRISYLVTDDSAIRPSTATFEASVDLSGIDPTRGPLTVPVQVRSVDERIQVLGYSPTQIRVQLDPFVSRMVSVRVEKGPVPSGLEVRQETVDPTQVAVSGPESVVKRVAFARASVVIETSALDVDRDVPLIPVDVLGNRLTPVDVQPETAHVTIPVFSELKTRSVAVRPTIIGQPAAGFSITSVEVDPPVVTVEGDPDRIAALDTIGTEAVSVSGAPADVRATVKLDLPTDVLAVGTDTVSVIVRLQPTTETRTFAAGILLRGARADRTYTLSTEQVNVTIFGNSADLARLTGSPLAVTADVASLAPGRHDVTLTLELPAGLRLDAVSPPKVSVVVAIPVAPSASPSPPPPSSEPSGSPVP